MRRVSVMKKILMRVMLLFKSYPTVLYAQSEGIHHSYHVGRKLKLLLQVAELGDKNLSFM